MIKRTVGVVEDDPTMCQMLVGALLRDERWALAFEAASMADVQSRWNDSPPDVMLIDLGLPDGDGLDLLQQVRTHWPQCECLIVSVFGDEDRVVRSIEAGAGGYILKGQGEEGIAEHMGYLLEGGSPMSPAIARHLLRRITRGQPPAARVDLGTASTPSAPNPAAGRPSRVPSPPGFETLTAREADVLTWLSHGEPYEEVARRLEVSVNTVRFHVKSLYGKLGVNSRHHAIREGQRRGWLAPDNTGSR